MNFEQMERFKRLDRSLKYCVECGTRLKEKSHDRVHKKCLLKFEDDDNEPKYDNNTGKQINDYDV